MICKKMKFLIFWNNTSARETLSGSDEGIPMTEITPDNNNNKKALPWRLGPKPFFEKTFWNKFGGEWKLKFLRVKLRKYT